MLDEALRKLLDLIGAREHTGNWPRSSHGDVTMTTSWATMLLTMEAFYAALRPEFSMHRLFETNSTWPVIYSHAEKWCEGPQKMSVGRGGRVGGGGGGGGRRGWGQDLPDALLFCLTLFLWSPRHQVGVLRF